MTEGIKYDKDKPELADFLLDFKEPLMELYKVWKFGKEKYGKGNWKEVKDGYRRYQNALIRHFFEEGSNTDAETDIYHAAHMAFNCLAMIKFLDTSECPTTNENDTTHKNIPDKGKTLNNEPASGLLVKVRNKKTGRFYNAWVDPENTIINTTNAQDGELMIWYWAEDVKNYTFVREKKEFWEKFEIV